MNEMKWKLKQAIKETDHPFLNFYTLVYDVEKKDGHHTYSYFMASRHDSPALLANTHDFSHPDGVIIPLYYKDPKTGLISLLMTSQFRPALGTYVRSFPAGLVDNNEDPLVSAKREAREEVGADITDLELLTPPSPTSSGLSDECNCVVLGRVIGYEQRELEEFEDISYSLIPLSQVKKEMDTSFFALQIRMIVLYLLERFKGQY